MDTALPRIIDLPAWTGAGFSLDCPPADQMQIGPLWEKLNSSLGKFSNHLGMYGVNLPLAGAAPGFRYWATVMLQPGTEVPLGLDIVRIPAKRFAVYPFHDHPSRMPQALQDICATRLSAAGLEADPDWVELEHYPPDWHDEAAGKFRCDLFVAIR